MIYAVSDGDYSVADLESYCKEKGQVAGIQLFDVILPIYLTRVY